MGQVGTDYGSERDTEEWVEALRAPLVVPAACWGQGSTGSTCGCRRGRRVLRSTVKWRFACTSSARARTSRRRRRLRVLVAAPDPLPELPLVQGTRAIANTLQWDIRTERPCYRPSEEVRGTITLTPREPVRRGDSR